MTTFRRNLRAGSLPPEYIMENWWPGSEDYEAGGRPTPRSAWDGEYQNISMRPYFARLIEWMRGQYYPAIEASGIAAEPITLGGDGRVHNGHHRILGAYILGWPEIAVEFVGPGPWWEEHVT